MSAIQRMCDTLDAILRRNGISKPNGQPLYSLQCEDEEFSSLQASLTRVMEFRTLVRREEYAAFCLVAAEWIRREHVEGSLTWRSILVDGMGVPTAKLEMHEKRVRDYTRDGMEWW